MKLSSNDKTLAAVVAAAVVLLAITGIMWRRDVSRLEEELRMAGEARLSRPAAPVRESDVRETDASAAAGDKESKPSGRPDYVPPSTKDSGLARFVNREASTTARIPRDITSRIPRVRDEEDIPVVVTVLRDTKDSDTVRNEAASLLRRSGYKGLTDDLIKILRNPEEGPGFRAFCVQHLWTNSKTAGAEDIARIKAEMYRAIGDPDVPVRREALLALVRMNDPKGRETAVEWFLAGKADGVRDAAIRCIRDMGLREHTPTIRKYLQDKNDVIRIAAIVTLSRWGDEQSRPAFMEAAASKAVRLQRAGKLALRRLDRAMKAARKTEAGGEAPVTTPKGGREKPDF